MSGPWEDFQSNDGPWNDFAAPKASTPPKTGKELFADNLRQEMQNASPFIRNLAGAGTALSDLWEGAKQFVGQGDADQIAANKIMAHEAPVGSFVGNAALTAIPFGLVGNSIKGAAAVGAGIGALEPVSGDQGFLNVAKGKLENAGVGAVGAAIGQKVANVAGDYVAGKLSTLAAKQAQNAPLTKTLQDGIDAGLVVPPSSVNPSWWNTTREGIAGKIATAQEASNRNSSVIDDLARKAVNLGPNDALTSDAMQAVRKQAYKTGYEPIEGFGVVKTDDAYHKALDAIASKYEGAAKDFPGAASSSVTDFINGTKKTKLDGQYISNDGDIIANALAPKAPKTRSLLDEIKKSGGLDVSEVGDLGIRGINKDYPGLLRKSGGNTADDLVELMQQRGWISAKDVQYADDNLVGGSHELARDMLRSALKREQVLHPADSAAATEYAGALGEFGKYGARPAVQADLPNTGGLRISQFDSANGLKMSQILRDEAGAAFRSGDSALGKAKKEAAKAIEDQIERAVAKEGVSSENSAALLQGFRDARQLMAKAHTVEDAIVEGGGTINPKKLAQRFQAGKPLSGDLQTIGAFANNFPKATQPAAQVAGPGVSKLNAFGALLAGGGGAAVGGPVGAAVGAIAPFVVPPAVRSILLSGNSQRNQLKMLYQLGLPTRTANALLQYAPVAGTVAGLNAFPQ